MRSPRASLPLLLVLLAGSVVPVLADGKFFPRVEVADAPGIAAQRAAIIFKDGVETLIVQSDVEGEGAAYGWILPLPAEPTSIEACAPNSLHALGQVVHPRIANAPKSILVFSLALMLVMVAFCVDHLRRSTREPGQISPVRVLVAILVTLLLASILLPSLARSRALYAGSNVDVKVLQTAKAGVYDVVVLKGETAEAVESWLSSNGFSCSPSATAVIGDYVAKEWCFLAAKVASELEGTLTHHPLKVTFATSEAIYPMRLTGIDGEPMQLDLYVVGERRASAPAMRTWLCDTYEPDDTHAWDFLFKEYSCEVPPSYRGKAFGSLGIPAITELMWPGCVLTRLNGRLKMNDMQEDLRVAWVDATPMRATVYSPSHAVRWSAALATLTFTGLFGWITWTAGRKRWSWQTMIRRRLAPAVVLAILVGAVRYATFDIVPMREVERRGETSTLYSHTAVLRELSEEPPDSPFPDAYRELLTDYELLSETDPLEKPGDFKIEAGDDGWRLTILDWYYVPITVLISADGTPRAAARE